MYFPNIAILRRCDGYKILKLSVKMKYEKHNVTVRPIFDLKTGYFYSSPTPSPTFSPNPWQCVDFFMISK